MMSRDAATDRVRPLLGGEVMASTRKALTIWELLFAIVIILFLLALLLPSVNVGRGGVGRKSVCVNNQRQLALALYQYEMAHGHYPGYVVPQSVLSTAQGEIASRPASWVFPILSRLERSDIADNYGAKAPAGPGVGPFARPDQRLNILVCPSDATSSQVPAPLSYVVNTGLKDPEPEMAMPAGIPRDWPENGIFHFDYPYTWKNDFDVPLRAAGDAPNSETITKVSAKFISDHDGLSTTLLLSENADSGQWTDVREHLVGFYWQATINGKPPALGNVAPDDLLELPLLRINEGTGLRADQKTEREQFPFGRPSSYHPGGVVVSYADAHTSFLDSSIDYLIYCQLMTPRGAQSGPAGPKGESNGQRIHFRDQPGDRANFATQAINEDEL